jgi:hypothetical protein
MAGHIITFTFSVVVCLFMHQHLSHVQNYLPCNYSLLAAFGLSQAKLQQASVVLCCIDGKKVEMKYHIRFLGLPTECFR